MFYKTIKHYLLYLHMQINAAGYLDNAHFIASPNFDQRPPGVEISLLVIHNISLPPDKFDGNGVIELFTNQINPEEHPYYQTLCGLKVSSHFFLRRDGSITQFVSCNQRAWHAGVSCWQEKECCNDYSIGIELEGSDNIPFTNEQYNTLTMLTQCLCDHYPITDIAGHSDIAPGRKTDPGSCFDWQQYARAIKNKSYFKNRQLLKS
jgi:N-acetyl-anhydromuramoyl-L-alanine amidase